MTAIQFILFHIPVLMCAVIGFVYSDVLTEPGMIASSPYKKLESKLPEMLFKPLIGCFKCVSGQLAFWGFLYIFRANYVSICNSVSFFDGLFLAVQTLFIHSYFICVTIYTAWILQKKYRS